MIQEYTKYRKYKKDKLYTDKNPNASHGNQ